MAKADDVLKAQSAEDAWNRSFLRRFYAARAQEILNSGNPYRIRLYHEHLAREEKRHEGH